jgi:hypothetical protein
MKFYFLVEIDIAFLELIFFRIVHQGVSEFVYFFAENAKIPPKIKIYKIHNKSTIRYNVIILKPGILESIKYL